MSIMAVKRALHHVSRKHRGNIKGKRCFRKKQFILGGTSFILMQLIGRNQVEQCYKIVLQYMSQIDIRHLDDVVDI